MSTKNVLLGVVAGAAVGAILGVLFAPDKGTETRRKIAVKGQAYKDAVAEKINDLVDIVSGTVTEVKDGARHLVEETQSKVRDMANSETGKFRNG